MFRLNVLVSCVSSLGIALSTGIYSHQKTFILVDPLDDYGSTAAVLAACSERGVLCQKMWTPGTASSLLAAASNALLDLDPIEVADVENDICPSQSGSKAAMEWLKSHSINSRDVLGVMCESDIGLKRSEEFSSSLELPTANGVNEARRDKYMMQQALTQAGLNTVRQVLTDDWSVAQQFLETLLVTPHHPKETVDTSLVNHHPKETIDTPPPPSSCVHCVIKPCRGAASYGVSKATSLHQAKELFDNLLGYPGYANGTVSDAVLVQECMDGPEYAVDTVTRDGEHKVVAVWRYDKRPANGAPFVYFCTEMVHETQDHLVGAVQAYAMEVLTALKVKWGPAHIEIKSCPNRGPLLVEANIGRWHGQDFITISNMAIGYNAVDVTVDAYISRGVGVDVNCNGDDDHSDNASNHQSIVDDDLFIKHSDEKAAQTAYKRWTSIPKVPPPLRCAARILHLVSNVEGTLTEPARHLKDIFRVPSSSPTTDNGQEEIEGKDRKDLTSIIHQNRTPGFRSLLRWVGKYDGDVGEEVVKTVDLHTTAGYALLVHPNKSVVDDEYARLVDMQSDMFVVSTTTADQDRVVDNNNDSVSR